jgi:hypothetical protein
MQLEMDMTIPLGTLLDYVRRKWRSRLTADAPSWAAGAIIRSISPTPTGDEGRDVRWRCARAPAFIRIFRRNRRSSSGTTMRLFVGTITLATAIAWLAGEVRAATVSVRASSNQLALICAKTGGEFFSSPTGYSCITFNCGGSGSHCSVTCNRDGACTAAVPSAPSRNAR